MTTGSGRYQAERAAHSDNSATVSVRTEVLWPNRPFPRPQTDLFTQEARH
jgi:hypothetical protein